MTISMHFVNEKYIDILNQILLKVVPGYQNNKSALPEHNDQDTFVLLLQGSECWFWTISS